MNKTICGLCEEKPVSKDKYYGEARGFCDQCIRSNIQEWRENEIK
jgi:hypothetical protein